MNSKMNSYKIEYLENLEKIINNLQYKINNKEEISYGDKPIIEFDNFKNIAIKEELHKIFDPFSISDFDEEKYEKQVYDIWVNDIWVNDILNYLSGIIEANGIMFFKYNKNKKNIILDYVSGLAVFFVDYIQQFLEECILNKDKYPIEEEVKKITSFWLPYIDIHGVSKKKRYFRCENVEIEGNFIGIIVFIKDDIELIDEYKRYSIDVAIKFACDEIGTIIYNNLLCDDLSVEIEKRKKSEEQLNLFLETASDTCLLIKDKGNIKSTIIGNHDKKVIYDKIDIKKILKIIEDDIEASSEKRFVRERVLGRNNDERTIEWIYKFYKENNMLALIGNDLTENYNLEKKKISLKNTIDIEDFKNRLLTNMSWEYKEPLNIILSIVQLLNLYADSNKTIEDNIKKENYIRGIKQNSYRLLKMVNNLIDISKFDNNHYDFKGNNYNVIEIIENVIEAINSYIRYKNPIIFDTDEEEVVTFCDKKIIETILLKIFGYLMEGSNGKEKIEMTLSTNKSSNTLIASITFNHMDITLEKRHEMYAFFQEEKESNLIMKDNFNRLQLALIKRFADFHNMKINMREISDESIEIKLFIPIKYNKKHITRELEDKSLNSLKDQCYMELL